MPNKIRVLIVDEFPIMRFGLHHFLDQLSGYEVTGEASCVAEALDLAQSTRPNIVLVDISPSKGMGICLATRLANRTTQVVAFSSDETWNAIREFLDAGGRAVVSRQRVLDELPLAITAAAAGRVWVSPDVRRAPDAAGSEYAGEEATLSRREREIVALVARGLTSNQIAEQLCVSRRTVETHRYWVFKKLGISSRAELVDYALKRNMLTV